MTRYLGLDLGDKTIGVAVSDPLGLTAQGVETIKRGDSAKDFARLALISEEYETKAFVLGLPKNMDGSEGERAEIVRNFAKELQGAIPSANIYYYDERLTTVAASRLLITGDVSRKKRKAVVDKMAAMLILQGFLDRLRVDSRRS